MLGAYPPSAVGANVIHDRSLDCVIFCLPVFADSVTSAAIRSAVALAADASAVVTSGSTARTGRA